MLEVLNYTVEEVCADEALSFSLIDSYRKLFLGGANCRTCRSSKQQYYSKLKLQGAAKLEQYKAVQSRTLVLNWSGNRFTKGQHVLSANLTDAEAIRLLNSGVLHVSGFDVLPKGYEVAEEGSTEEGNTEEGNTEGGNTEEAKAEEAKAEEIIEEQIRKVNKRNRR